MRSAHVSRAGEPATTVGTDADAPHPLRFLVGAAALGSLLVLAGVGLSAVFDLEPPTRQGLGRLLDYGGRGIAPIAMVVAVGVVVVGLAMTVFHAVHRVIRTSVAAARYVAAHTIRHLVGTVAPFVFPAAWFVGFSLATGGAEAIGYWLVAILGALVLGVLFAYWVGIFMALFEPVGNFVGRLVAIPVRHVNATWAGRVEVGASHLVRVGPPAVLLSLVWVYHAAALGDAPSRLPWTESGWGQYLGFLALLSTTWTMLYFGGRLNDRWVERPEPAPQPPGPATSLPRTRLGWAAPDLHPAPPPPDPFWSPDVVSAWRAWVWADGELRGVWQPWRSAEFEAVCATCDEVPGWDHVCGIYAVKDPRQLHVFNRPTARDRLVVGRVELSGLLVEHEVGYRAQHARIVELFAPARLVKAIQSTYPDVNVRPAAERGAAWPT